MFSRRRTDVSPAPTAGSSESEKQSENRSRRRLSKPMTNKSSTNLRLHALQQGNTSRNSSTTQLPPSPMLPPPAFDQSRDLIKAHIFDSDSDASGTRSLASDPGGWKGTAFMVKNIEASVSVDGLLAAPSTPTKKSRRPFSAIFGSRPSSHSNLKSLTPNGSQDQLNTAKGAPITSASFAESKEDVGGAPPLRAQRRTSFNPGEATRLEKTTTSESPAAEGLAGIVEDTVQGQPARFSFESEWVPPPRVERTETPINLESTHLGGLRLGSLHIVNGRASPAPSELSKYLSSQPMSTTRREVSSEYGDSEAGIPTISSLMKLEAQSFNQGYDGNHYVKADSSPPPSPNNVVLAEPETQSSPVKPHTPDRFVMPRRKPVASPDKTSMMAMAYMADLPDSPFSARRSASPTGSVIITRSKATEFDDHLFDDETMAPSIHSEADRETIDTWYNPSDAGSVREDAFSSTLEFQRQMSPQKLEPPKQYTLNDKSDSGYSSNVSLRDDVSEEIKPAPEPEPSDTSTPTLTEASLAKPRPRLMRPISILKQSRATAPELPTFSNLQKIASPTPSTVSAQSDQAPKSKPRKLQKPRRKSQVVPVEQIMVQGAHLEGNDIPPVPPGILANLYIRTQQVPELEKTFNSMQHTRNQPSMSDMSSLIMPDVRFPSPGPDSEPEIRYRPASFRRRSFMGRTPSERRLNHERTSTGISEADAMAIIHGGFGGMVSSLGSSPYDAIPSGRPPSQGPRYSDMGSVNTMNAYNPPPQKIRPKSMMDDRTAAELARLRSRAALERETLHERRAFNDRGGIPGRNLRPASIASDAPPLPPLPSQHVNREANQHANQHQSWQGGTRFGSLRRFVNTPQSAQEQQWPTQSSPDSYDSPAPLPPKHSPRPAFIEPADEVEDMSLAPPPPSHSPRPMVLDSADGAVDVWTVQAQAWKSRRQAADMLSTKSFDEREKYNSYDPQQLQPEPLYPEIPMRQSQQNHLPRMNHWQPQRTQTFPANHTASYVDDYEQPAPRALPTPSGNSYWAEQIDRPRSRASQLSFAGSLAESLHPAEMERPQPPHQFGRYSGGMNYGYERDAGFSGSAGTRSMSGTASATRKGVPLRADYGIDLGDVPVIAGLQRL